MGAGQISYIDQKETIKIFGTKGLENLTLTRYIEDKRNGGWDYPILTTWCRKKGIYNGEGIAESNKIYEDVKSLHL